MSCVVGLIDNGRVWMGGDSQAIDAVGYQDIDANPKVFHRGNLLLGAVGSIRLRQLLRYEELPSLRVVEPGLSIEVLAEAIRQIAKENDLVTDGEIPGAAVMVGFAGHLALIQTNFGVISPMCGYSATGTGGPVALGALSVLMHSNKSAEERVRQALAASAQWQATVRPPFVIESL